MASFTHLMLSRNTLLNVRGPPSLRVRISWMPELLKGSKLCTPESLSDKLRQNISGCALILVYLLRYSKSFKRCIAWWLTDRKAEHPTSWLPACWILSNFLTKRLEYSKTYAISQGHRKVMFGKTLWNNKLASIFSLLPFFTIFSGLLTYQDESIITRVN
jgi:hypothetical protein